MEYYYIGILAFLGLLAVVDLFAGVSNDAVNFLNAAIGSRVATFRTVMWTATLGVLLGTTFSSGMMEIARSGVFHPQMFTFSEIMVIFLAVMIADVILLDIFNSLGLPTSTTVSIVFDLLGAALMAAIIKLWGMGEGFSAVWDYINTSKCLTIISGILISVVVAFISGMVVQYIVRVIFSFNFEAMYRRIGGVFGALCITGIIFFLVMKGAKGASFMQPEWLAWMNAYTLEIVLTLFVGFSVVFSLGIWFFNLNIFKIVILLGTFSLAFAFAGNDLVNFVGVPLAALDSFFVWKESGISESEFMMGGLLAPTQANTFFLVASGVIMALTLWFSKKARRVIQTSLNLSSQQSDQELFGASRAGRMIVRSGMALGTVINHIVPGAVRRPLDARFAPKVLAKGEEPLPFDYVRASVNLMISAILIASATSLKLPLSTTYVTFMVAMGSSFADGAWDRESAVYRISGVLTVISGWFMTAFCASSLAMIVCATIFLGGAPAAFALSLLVLFLLVRSNRKAQAAEERYQAIRHTTYDAEMIRDLLNRRVGEELFGAIDRFGALVKHFLDDKERGLTRVKRDIITNVEQLTRERNLYYRMADTEYEPTKADRDARYAYFRTYTNMREVSRSEQALAKLAREHIANRHRTFKGEPAQDLQMLVARLKEWAVCVDGMADPHLLAQKTQAILALTEEIQERLLTATAESGISSRGCELYLTFLLFARDMVNHYEIVSMLQQKLKTEAKA